ncbi:MAG: hypothetical protein AB8I08_22435 [Sandaracinaceae bacterium]
MVPRRILCLLGVLACGCDDAMPLPDADPDVDAGSLDIAAPATPALPVLTPCPDGWAPVFGTAGAPECDPLPEDPGLCSLGVIVVGRGCVELGPTCPSDGWPADLPDDAVFVDPAALAGDGSRGAPFALVDEALQAAPVGGTVALRVGSHAVNARLDRDVTLRGACQETRLTSDREATAANDAVLTAEATVVIEDLSIRAASRGGLLVAAGAEATVRRLSIFAVSGFGLGVEGLLTAEDISIDGVRGGLLGGGRGITVEGDGDATMRRVSIVDASEVGAFSAARLVLEDAALIGSWDPELGFVFDAAPGISAEAGGTVTLTRGLLASHTAAGARASGGGTLVLEDVVLRDNREEAIRLSEGASVDLTRCTIGPGHPWGVLALDAGTRVRADHLLLTGATVRGLSAGGGAQLTLRHTLVANGEGGGVLVDGAGGSVMAEDLTVRDIDGDGSAGRGVGVQRGATLQLTRVDVARARGAAVGIFGDGTPHRLQDVTLRETRSRRDDGRGGSGLLVVGEGVEVDVERALLTDNRSTAIIADQRARVTLTNTRILDTQPQDCASVSCPDEPGGTGIGVYRGAAVTGSSFEIAGSPLCGVQVAEGGQLDLVEGRVTDGLIGACVQVEDFDVGRIERGVTYVRNERNLDSASRTIPASQLPSVPPTGG